jgi:hypothetical protein
MHLAQESIPTMCTLYQFLCLLNSLGHPKPWPILHADVGINLNEFSLESPLAPWLKRWHVGEEVIVSNPQTSPSLVLCCNYILYIYSIKFVIFGGM